MSSSSSAVDDEHFVVVEKSRNESDDALLKRIDHLLAPPNEEKEAHRKKKAQKQSIVLPPFDRRASGIVAVPKSECARHIANSLQSSPRLQLCFAALLEGTLSIGTHHWSWPLVKERGQVRLALSECEKGVQRCLTVAICLGHGFVRRQNRSANDRNDEDEQSASLVLLCPVTRRRRQLTTHCSAAGHRIVGDYSHSESMMMHCVSLAFDFKLKRHFVSSTLPFADAYRAGDDDALSTPRGVDNCELIRGRFPFDASRFDRLLKEVLDRRDRSGDSATAKWRIDGDDQRYRDVYWQFALADRRDDDDAQASSSNAPDVDVPRADVDEERTWRDVDFEELRAHATAVLASKVAMADDSTVRQYDEKAGQYWDDFYRLHENTFFKERNYLLVALAPLVERAADAREPVQVLDVGCGTGAAAFPLLRDADSPLGANSYWHMCDVSPTAIELVRANELYDEQRRCAAFAMDVAKQPSFPATLPPIDAALLVFVLSALDPRTQMRDALRKIRATMKLGALLYFRDYGIYDMVMLRFIAKQNVQLAEQFFLRRDGTRAYFFERDASAKLFGDAGFRVRTLDYDTRELKNRKRGILMYRCWIEGLFEAC
jgi:tRNA N(3)-methylcytidine methyltransferase METTL6